MDYAECIQVQARNLSWAKQVKNGKVQHFFLSYTSLKNITLETMNMKPAVKHVHIPYILKTNNTFVLGLELLVILYQANQPADPQLLNSNFCSILLFGIDKYLAGNAKNIICPLLRMGMFIKQHPLENRTAEDIS